MSRVIFFFAFKPDFPYFPGIPDSWRLVLKSMQLIALNRIDIIEETKQPGYS